MPVATTRTIKMSTAMQTRKLLMTTSTTRVKLTATTMNLVAVESFKTQACEKMTVIKLKTTANRDTAMAMTKCKIQATTETPTVP